MLGTWILSSYNYRKNIFLILINWVTLKFVLFANLIILRLKYFNAILSGYSLKSVLCCMCSRSNNSRNPWNPYDHAFSPRSWQLARCLNPIHQSAKLASRYSAHVSIFITHHLTRDLNLPELAAGSALLVSLPLFSLFFSSSTVLPLSFVSFIGSFGLFKHCIQLDCDSGSAHLSNHQ